MMHDHFDRKEASELEKSLGYKFKNTEFLEEALSHPSLRQIGSKNTHIDYERFELLGDSILNFIIIEILFNKFAELSEGDIVKIKSFLVSKDVISKISREKLALENYLLMTRGEENSGGRENPNNLENAFEALVAAIYLDSDISQTRDVVEKLWHEYIHEFDSADIDPKTTLQEWAQKRKYRIPGYVVVDSYGPVHSPVFTVKTEIAEIVGVGEGGSIKTAEKMAAKDALRQIKESGIYE